MSSACFDIDALRESVRSRMDGRRFAHTLGVEREAAALGELFLPEKVSELRCAALLHDITKNETTEKQLQYISEFGIMMSGSDKASPKLLHAITAATLIERDYPQYVSEEIVSAVRWHTTGREGMTLFDSLIYLADYIEDTRTFEDCIRLREYFWGKAPADMTMEQRLLHLYRTVSMSFDMTINGLVREGSYIAVDTVECRNYYLRLQTDLYRKTERHK